MPNASKRGEWLLQEIHTMLLTIHEIYIFVAEYDVYNECSLLSFKLTEAIFIIYVIVIKKI